MINILLIIILLLILFLISLVISFRLLYIKNVNVLYNKIKNINDNIHLLIVNNEHHMVDKDKIKNMISTIKKVDEEEKRL